MKPTTTRAIAALLCAVAIAAATGCALVGTTGSGRLVTDTVDTEPFTAVEAQTAFEVTIRQGDDHEVLLRVDDNIRDLVRVEVRGERLVLRLRPQASVRSATLEAEVTMPGLDRVDASGAARVTIADTFDSDRLELEASGASRIEGELRADQTGIEASGASRVTLSGQTGTLRARASGASTLELDGFDVDELEIELSGASNATATVHEIIDARLSGASSLRYAGEAEVRRSETSGASSIGRR